MVDDFTGKYAEKQWDRLRLVIVKDFLPRLRTWIGNDWVLAALDEGVDLGIQIGDVLIGPL